MSALSLFYIWWGFNIKEPKTKLRNRISSRNRPISIFENFDPQMKILKCQILFWKAQMSYFLKTLLSKWFTYSKLLKWFESSKLDKTMIFKDFWSYIMTHYHLPVSYLSESLSKCNFWKVWHLNFLKPYRLSSYYF